MQVRPQSLVAGAVAARGGEPVDQDQQRREPVLVHVTAQQLARLVHGQRRRRLNIPSTWPWASQIAAAFTRIAAIPAPG